MAEKQSKTDSLIKEIESLTVLELNELVKVLEEKFGVSAAVAVAPGTVPGSGVAAAETAAETGGEEKSEYTVELTAAGGEKIKVIKAVRELNQQLGLKEAKDLVEAAPKTVLEKVKKEEAEEAKKKLEAAGAKVVLK